MSLEYSLNEATNLNLMPRKKASSRYHGWKCWFFSPKLLRNFVFRASTKRNKGAKCWRKKYPKISLKIEEISVGGEISTIFSKKKIASSWKKIRDISVYLAYFSLIFWKNRHPPLVADPMAPSLLVLI